MPWIANWMRPLAVALIVTLSSAAVMPPPMLAGPQETLRDVAVEVEAKAGGWGFLTPVIAFTARGVQAAAAPDASRAEELRDVPGFLGDRRFLGGLAGGMLFAKIFGAIAAAMPGGILLKTVVAMSGGFIGCEVGSGTLGRTDWLNLATQVAVASLVQVGGAALGLGGLPLLLLAAGAAIASGILLDRALGKEEGAPGEAKTPSSFPGSSFSSPSDSFSSSLAALPERDQARRDGYRDLIRSLSEKASPEVLGRRLEAYGERQRSLQGSRRLAFARP